MKPKHESARHCLALDYYHALGDERSLREVAKRFNTSETSVRNWSTAFKWAKRIEEREHAVAQLLKEKGIEDAAESRDLQIKICRSVQASFALALTRKEVGVTVQDFVKAAQHELLLRGKATERSEVVLQGEALEKIVQAVATVIEKEVPEHCPNCSSELGIKAKLAEGISRTAQGFTH